jgi:PAS domain S-box-containing protein
MEEELLRLSYALEQSQNIIMITDKSGNIQYINPKFSEVTGYKREEAIGKNPRILKSGELSQDVYAHLWKTIADGQTWRGEFHNRKKNGQLYWERATIASVKDRQGNIISYLAVKEDITQEKKLAQDLQKAFGRLKEMERIINLSNAIVFMWSPDQPDVPVKFVSDNIRNIGLEPEDFYVRGMRIRDFIFEDDRASVMEIVKRNTLARKLEFSQQYRVKGADGKIRWFEEHAFVSYTKKGEPEYIQSVAFDITDRKIAEERMLEAVNMKSEFISIVSHELRTPLTAVKESINIVAEEEAGPLEEMQKKFLGIAKRNVDRLGALINDVLDYQKLDMGKLNFEWEDLDIRPLIIDASKTMEIVAKNKGLDIQAILPEGEIPKVHADADRIIQVLNNLINNAIKFTDRGGIRVELVCRSEGVQVLVKDSGIGIKPQEMHKLFQTFSQIRSGSERRSGETGLGLAISKKIIDSHGGSIWAESVFGQGTTFTFILPIKV